MFLRRLNSVQVTLQLVPAAPLLVKEGRHGEGGNKKLRSFHRGVTRNPPRPRRKEGRGYSDYDTEEDCFDMACVWTQTSQGPRFYLPGSSLRGMLRAAAEQVIGRWQPEWTRASDPFRNVPQQWVEDERAVERSPDGDAIYRMAGPIERCFGHTALRGRWTIADAWMQDEQQANVVVRDGVGINRRTGAAVNDIKFQFEAITGGVFETTLTLVNYELWQLGLLAHVLAAIDAGRVRLGYGIRRGLGQVRLAVTELRWQWYGQPHLTGPDLVIPSLATLAATVDVPGAYGWRDQTHAPLHVPGVHVEETEATLGTAWIVRPHRAAIKDGFAATDWLAPPWPQFAATLPDTLPAWTLPPELRTIMEAMEAMEAQV